MGIFITSSCNNWLEVQPETKFTENQVFSSVNGTASALNSIYIKLGDNKLYGANLTSTFVEILAQRYKISSVHNKYQYVQYNYTDPDNVSKDVDVIWTNLYANILSINNFLDKIAINKGVLNGKTDSLFRGEAHALRAMLHLDALRLFGPIYSVDSTSAAIPYIDKVGNSVSPLLPANQVMSHVLADLSTAEGLLSTADPIVTGQGIKAGTTPDNYNYNRQYRLNYYAVKGLKARANLYRGNKAAALVDAKAVIDKQSYFPWVIAAEAAASINPNRIFTTEVLFGTSNNKLPDLHKSFFNAEVFDQTLLAPENTRLQSGVFENNTNDIRFSNQWKQTREFKTFVKYADIADNLRESRYMISLLRMSEMYYIAAECLAATSPAMAVDYLNIVRSKRGLDPLSNSITESAVMTEVQKEYKKEFFGEGQLFFMFKRLNLPTIENGVQATGVINMTKAQYVLPLPLSETQYR